MNLREEIYNLIEEILYDYFKLCIDKTLLGKQSAYWWLLILVMHVAFLDLFIDVSKKC